MTLIFLLDDRTPVWTADGYVWPEYTEKTIIVKLLECPGAFLQLETHRGSRRAALIARKRYTMDGKLFEAWHADGADDPTEILPLDWYFRAHRQECTTLQTQTSFLFWEYVRRSGKWEELYPTFPKIEQPVAEVAND